MADSSRANKNMRRGDNQIVSKPKGKHQSPLIITGGKKDAKATRKGN